MSRHPIVDLTQDREVKQAKGFRAAAEKMTGESLETAYQAEAAAAPHRSAADLKYLGVRVGRRAKARQNGKDERHLAEALARGRQSAEGEAASETPANLYELPSGENLLVVDHSVPIRTAAPDKAKGDADPNAGVEEVPFLAVLGDDRLAVGVLKYLEPEATRSGAGDTPLRLLLHGLAHAAAVDANREPLAAEIAERSGKTIGEEAPAIVIAASPRYWQLCRKREAQKGAGWIRELERISREVGESIGCEVIFVGVETDGVPGWGYDDEGAVLTGPVKFVKSWESGAGKLKPKPKTKKVDPADEIVQPDFSKPVRAYSIRDSYEPGDRIQHTKLGEGVVQAITGRGKISVLFGDDAKLLIHERS